MEDWIFYSFPRFMLSALLAAVVLVVTVSVVVRYASRHYDKAACASFSVQSDRETRFVDYTFWSWDCLTPSADGKWISTSALRDITR